MQKCCTWTCLSFGDKKLVSSRRWNGTCFLKSFLTLAHGLNRELAVSNDTKIVTVRRIAQKLLQIFEAQDQREQRVVV